MSEELLCGVCGRAFNWSAFHMCVTPPPVEPELAEARAEIARLTVELAYASDPFNWAAMWTGDEAMGWAITHGNHIQIGDEQGQVFMRMREKPDA